MKEKKETINDVVQNDLCTGCGFCTSICPKRCITMREHPGGLLRADVGSARCISCSRCIQLCGGHSLDSKAFNLRVDPFTESVLKSFLARATDHELLLHGQSGGAVTALASSLLRKHVVQGVVVATMPSDGSFQPRPMIARRPEDLYVTQGSQYVSVPVGIAMREIEAKKGPWAIVGLPCHFHSLFNARERMSRWTDSIALKIGLVCERVLSRAIFDCLLAEKSLSRSDCRSFRFRSKERIGWPGEDQAVLNDGSCIFIEEHKRHEYKDAMTPNRCRLCFDKMNILADVIASDPWGFPKEKTGSTMLAARTDAGLQAIEHAIAAKSISVKEVEWHRVLQGLRVEEKRRRWSQFTRYLKSRNEKTPCVDIGIEWCSQSFLDTRVKAMCELMFQRGKTLKNAETRRDVLDSIPMFQKQMVSDRLSQGSK